jgi:signal transduction histidine kinase
MSTRSGSVDIPLRLSLLFAVIALIAIVVLVLGQRWYATIEEEAEDMVEQGRIIGANASAALLFDDRDAGGEMLGALKNSSYVVEAALYRADGTQLANYARQPPVLLPTRLENNATETEGRTQTLTEMRITFPVTIGERNVGTIILRSSMQRVYRELLEFFEFFLMILVVSVALAYFASFRLRRRIRESRTELVDSQYMIRQLSVHREQLVEAEHKRIAIEIHDDLGQILTTAMMHLKRLNKSLAESNPAAAGQVSEIQVLVEEAFRSIKNIAMDLRPAVLNIGFTAALEWLVERTLGGSEIRFHLDIDAALPELDDRCSTTLFRIAQESLSNIVRHAQAGNVWIAVKVDNEQLSLTIEDDGIGFGNNANDIRPRFGLMGIRERAESLQGYAEITSKPQQGVCVLISVPLSLALRQRRLPS